MQLRINLVFLVVVACVLAACGGGTSSSTSTRISKSSTSHVAKGKLSDEILKAQSMVPRRSLKELPFEFSWDLELPAPVHISWVDKAIPDTLFLQTKKRQIHAIDIKSGHTKWVSRSLPKLMELPPNVVREELPGRKKGEIILDDRLYVISDSILFCIDAVYGQVIWRFVLPFEPSTGPYATGSGKGLRVFMGDWQGHLRVVTYHEEKMNPYVLWQWNLRGAAMADPVGTGGLVYIGNDRGVLQCFDHDRELNWEFKIGNTMRGEPIHRGRSLYFGSTDNVFHVINRLSGQVMGQLYLDAPIERSPFTFSFDPKRIYLWTSGNKEKHQGLYAVDSFPDKIPYKDTVDEMFDLEVERLKVAWFVPGLRSVVASTKKHLFATYGGGDSVVYAINRKTGKAEWAWDVAVDLGQTSKKAFQFCQYVDYTGQNQSIITYDMNGKLVAYKMFGQYSTR